MDDFFKATATNGLGSFIAALLIRLIDLALARIRTSEVATPRHGNDKDNISEQHGVPTKTMSPSNTLQEDQQAKTRKGKLLQILCNKYVLIFVYFFVLISFINAFTPLKITYRLAIWIFESPPAHEKWTAEAWDALDHKNPTQAIGAAEKVIDNYAGDVEQAEDELKNHEPMPPLGHLEGSARERIFARGVLNDVATSYWIAGQAYAQLGNSQRACENYRAAARLHYARTWDPGRWAFRSWNFGGQFWSPATKAAWLMQSKC